jgi:hypothetical protein
MSNFQIAAVCDDCWDRRRPDRPSPRTGNAAPKFCHTCAALTCSGILLKLDFEAEPAKRASIASEWESYARALTPPNPIATRIAFYAGAMAMFNLMCISETPTELAAELTAHGEELRQRLVNHYSGGKVVGHG